MPIISQDTYLDFEDVLIKPRSGYAGSRKDVNLSCKNSFKDQGMDLQGIPLVASNMDATGTWQMNRALRQLGAYTALAKGIPGLFTTNKTAELTSAFVTFGLEPTLEYLIKAYELGAELICLDIANGYLSDFVTLVKNTKKACAEIILMAGNVADATGAKMLASAGADIIKVGVGPGSVCETRRVTGVGVPQLSAILDVAAALKGTNTLLCSDGGCKSPGDIAKAFIAGANFVMLGGMLAGHEECDGPLELIGNNSYKKFYGMASNYSLEQQNKVREHRTSEGRAIYAPYKGPVATTMEHIMGGLRSACSYTGCNSLQELIGNPNIELIRVNRVHSSMYKEQNIPLY